MRIAYLSLDEVNQSLARRMAEACHADLEVRLPVDPPVDGDYQAVLWDLDFWPSENQDAAFERLLADRHRKRVAVHSYRLPEEQAHALRRRGVGVFRMLEPEVLRWLVNGAAPGPASGEGNGHANGASRRPHKLAGIATPAGSSGR
jgi:hypothetical protein